MANGKIIYTPSTTTALLLDGAHYLSIAETAFNPGTGHFGVDALLSIDSTVADAECWIVAKGVANLAGAAGWHFYYKPGTRRLGLRLNDGAVSAVVVETADNQIPALGNNFWARLQVDRTNGLALFYVNGLLVKSADISTVTGSLDNAAALKVGGYDASTNRHEGSLDFIRFDQGRVLPAAWHEEEWYRLEYGCRRLPQDFLAFWTFYGESLTDVSANAYELTWQGGGDPGYDPGWPGVDGAITYQFAENFEFGHEVGYLDMDDNQRLLNGSDYTYPHPNPKRTFVLPFKNIAPEQQAAFDGAWTGKQPVRLYLDAGRPETASVKLKTYPLQQSVFSTRVDAELDMEEV